MRALSKLFTGMMLAFCMPDTLAQEPIANLGAMQLHGVGGLGFHSDFENNGPFSSPEGLVGFYNNSGGLNVRGTEIPHLYDVEFAALGGLALHIPIEIANNANLIQGDLQTSRKTAAAYPLFGMDAFYTGQSGSSKVDGYAAMEYRETFRFPVGDASRLRWLQLESQALNSLSRCAYFFEDPKYSETLDIRNETGNSVSGLQVSTEEFWVLTGSLPSRVTLSWDAQSRIESYANALQTLSVVGWNKSTETWDNLGNTRVEGDQEGGSVTSDLFIPDQYAAITLGGVTDSEEPDNLEALNHFLSPNGDGRNDQLILEAAQAHPRNSLQVYNRYGQLVFEKANYQGEFIGRANVRGAISSKSGLNSGVYFYILTLKDLDEKLQGYLYLAN